MGIIGIGIGIGIGAAMAYIYGKNDLELLLACCFWGSSEKYPFWEQGSKYDPFDTSKPRPYINERLNKAFKVYEEQTVSNAYNVELQEFQNIFNRPTLTIDHKQGQSDYHFTLPNFKLGMSQLYFEVMVNKLVHPEALHKMGPLNYQVVSEYNPQLTQQLKDRFNSIKHSVKAGSLQFTLTLAHNYKEDIALYWYYEPSPGVKVPKRYLVENEVLDEAIIGMLDNNFMPSSH